MRALALLAMWGCGSAAPAPAPSPSPTDAADAAGSEPFVRTARIEVSRTPGHEGWMDIELHGDEYRAEQLCQFQLAQHERIRHLRPDSRVVQPCSPTPLPVTEPHPGTYLLVDAQELSERDFSPEIILAPDPTPWQRGAPARGQITSYQRFADLASCRQSLDRLLQARADTDAENTQSIRRGYTEQLARARDTETRACGASRLRVAECAQQPEPDRARCDFDVELSTRECNNARALVKALQKRLSMPSLMPARPSPVCRPE